MSGEPTGYCKHCGNDIDPHHLCGCYDVCVCGDYKHDHDGGDGACIFNGALKFDLTHGGEDCMKFRSATKSDRLVDWRDAFKTD